MQWAVIEIKTHIFGLLYTAFEVTKLQVLFGGYFFALDLYTEVI